MADQLSRELVAIPEVVLEILGGTGSSLNEGRGIAGTLMTSALSEVGVSMPSGMINDSVSRES